MTHVLAALEGRDSQRALALLAAAVDRLLPDPGVAEPVTTPDLSSSDVQAVLDEARRQLDVAEADSSALLDILTEEMQSYALQGMDVGDITLWQAPQDVHEAREGLGASSHEERSALHHSAIAVGDVLAHEGGDLYAIDTIWFEENGFSFDDFVQSRMCDSCQARLDEEVEERYTVLDKKSGRASFEIRRGKYGANAIRVIRDCCSKKRHYITPDMPTMEAVFRIFLANGNAPMTLGHVREQLAEWCPGGGCMWLLLPLDQFERLVQQDRYYGIRLVGVSVGLGTPGKAGTRTA